MIYESVTDGPIDEQTKTLIEIRERIQQGCLRGSPAAGGWAGAVMDIRSLGAECYRQIDRDGQTDRPTNRPSFWPIVTVAYRLRCPRQKRLTRPSVFAWLWSNEVNRGSYDQRIGTKTVWNLQLHICICLCQVSNHFKVRQFVSRNRSRFWLLGITR